MARDLMRLRFAPSPTGALHIGGARTALYNWLLARHEGGALLLRIEDTDAERSTPENVQQILDSLRWLELDWDEGPLLQSARGGRHQEVLGLLLARGHAYRSRATAQDVAAYKARHGADRGFRGEPDPAGEGAVRLRVPDGGATVVHDVIRGETRFEHVHLDDPVIARGDRSVLYNFAVAVDDLDSGITHVVRGEDHLSNTPKQLLVMAAMRAAGIDPLCVGGEDRGSAAEHGGAGTGEGGDALPLYAHLPLLHGPDGKKLSKRHGAASVQELRDAGYLPAAVRNYLALLGWGAGDDATVLSTEELVARFTLERVSRNPARFDETKLRWLNGVHIRATPAAALAEPLLELEQRREPGRAQALARDRTRLHAALGISQEKIHTLADFWPLAGFLFADPVPDEKAIRRWLDAAGRERLAEVRAELASAGELDRPEVVERALRAVLDRHPDVKPGAVYQPLRVAISGTSVSPGIFESVALLGRDETLARVDAALARAPAGAPSG
jgi:glutamyl/glutaminyl-tRNA synthetase